MRSLLFQVPPLNVAVLVAAACVTAAVCLAACLLPSQRAAQISPMEALAEEYKSVSSVSERLRVFRFLGCIKSPFSELARVGHFAASFQYKKSEIGGDRDSAKLAHFFCHLAPMVSGMVRQMLHQVRQTDFCCEYRKHPS